MTDLAAAYATRDLMLERLEQDLLGGDFDNEITEAPLSRFVLGVLYPASEDSTGRPVEQTVDGDAEIDVDSENVSGTTPDAPVDPAVSLSRVRQPRSMGLTVAITATPNRALAVTIEAASYQHGGGDLWRRNHLRTGPLTVDCTTPGIDRHTVTAGLQLVTTVRAPRTGAVAVTVSLVNTAVAPRGDKDAACWFNPRLTLRPVDTAFDQRPPAVVAGTTEDEVDTQRLLFRDVHTWAVGHGCATTWQETSDGWVDTVATTFIPRHELLLSDTAGAEGVNLNMTHLGTSTDYTGLDNLVDLYEAWIENLAGTPDLSPREQTTLDRHRLEATEAAERMRDGISLLRDDRHIRIAFQLTNLAMAEQRSRQEHHRGGHLGDPSSTAGASWRPFQIAFILTNLRGLADGTHPDRSTADVLWFPTGGGKTEAYLGLIGITILLRRLRNQDAAGVSVLMRYTLRLLTLQQYQRATGLICALEHLRHQQMPDTAEISIGLWVGQGSTPNSVDEARRALNKARRGRATQDTDDDTGDPVQLRQCPWCGTLLDHDNYEIVDRLWMRVACGTPTCAFRNGLPVHILDDDVYRSRPSLVIATVDKFAMLPWKREAGSLLGVPLAEGDADRYPPPDLIVQDELHLISGPLGTVVGLYETAIDAICSRTTPPKLVASTATIRRARDQVRAVFAREARQFPPPGLTHRDSYFAVEAPRTVKGSRGYAGIMAPGASHTTLMVRVYASLLQSASTAPADKETADLYWTLLGYFNSLRVLGGAYIQVLDDVPDQMLVVAGRRGEDPRARPQLREMTSRKKSWEIPDELKILEQRRGEPEAADVVLATNMISVGVDVDRLGLMVVMGQPQTSSEYIQATSRVGRRLPGLVVTLYNAARSRDLSHYENFSAYHRMLYRHVEATAATPFAPRARDRALHAVLVSLARHTIPAASPSAAAADAGLWQPDLDTCVDVILKRLDATRHPNEHTPADEGTLQVRDQLETLIDEWTGSRLERYEGWFGRWRGALLVEASRALSQGEDTFDARFPPSQPPWPTLTSMRDVDAESSIYLVRARRRSTR